MIEINIFKEKIEESLHVYQIKNAIFLAERLCDVSKNEDNLLLLATCYYRDNKPNKAKMILTSYTSKKSRYLYSLCCYELDLFAEAESVMLQDLENCSLMEIVEEITKSVECIPNGSAGLELLGNISSKSQKKESAIQYYTLALKYDPFLFSAYECLCKLGGDLIPENAFKWDALIQVAGTTPSTMTPVVPSFLTPQKPNINYFASSVSYSEMTPMTKTANVMQNLNLTESTSSPSFPLSPTNNSGVRRSARLAKPSPSPSNTGTEKHLTGTKRGYSQYKEEQNESEGNMNYSLHRGQQQRTRTILSHQPIYNTISNEELQGHIDKALDILINFGNVMYSLSRYRCEEALDMLNNLPNQYKLSGWSQHQIGRCHFELNNLDKSIEAFEKMRKLEPYRMEGLEYYSAALWKLHKKVELTYLSSQVVEFDRKCPETWCVIGNCFSLQKDHEAAIKFFQRSFQIDPLFTYAYTLIGHEYVSNDQFDKAADCFRNAIRIDDRHYNAWSGLAYVYFREEKFDLAEYHFKYAENINPDSPTLLTYLGLVQLNRNDFEAALFTFERIIAKKSNPRAKFHHASVLLSLERFEEAYTELKEVCDYFPTEPQVHIMMAKICKKLNLRLESFRHYNLALDLDIDPKAINDIKNAMDKLNSPDVEEEFFG